MKLQQRLKRSLALETSMRDENEELKRKLVVVGGDEVGCEDCPLKHSSSYLRSASLRH